MRLIYVSLQCVEKEHEEGSVKVWNFTEGFRRVDTSGNEQGVADALCANEGDVCLCHGGSIYYGNKSATDLSELKAFAHAKASRVGTGLRCTADAFKRPDLDDGVDRVCWCAFPSLSQVHVQKIIRKRRETPRYCPQIEAYDEKGFYLYSTFPRTKEGDTVQVRCPDIGFEKIHNVTRSCSENGNWLDVEGACESALPKFIEHKNKFIPGNDLEFAGNRTVLHFMNVESCAYYCLTAFNCSSFEISKTTSSQTTCTLSSVSPAILGNTSMIESYFQGSISIFELGNPSERDTIEILGSGNLTFLPVEYTTAEVCDMNSLGKKYGWPVHTTHNAYHLRTAQHLRELESEECLQIIGNFILDCTESCSDKLNLSFALLGGLLDPEDSLVSKAGQIRLCLNIQRNIF